MTAPALNDTWYGRGNVLFPDITTAPRIWMSWNFNLKCHLTNTISTGTIGTNGARPVGSAWTIEGSCDGTTAGMDGVDRWTSTFDATKIVLNNTGSAHSWAVLKSPLAFGPLYMCLDTNSSSNGTGGIIFSSTPFTGGNTTTRPTATKEFAVNLGSAPNTSTQTTLSSDFTLASTFRSHFAITADGDWHYATSRDTTGIIHSYVSCSKLLDVPSGDLAPWVAICANVTSSRGSPTQSDIYSHPRGSAGRVWNDSQTRDTGGWNNWTFGGTSLSSMKADILESKQLCLPFYFFDGTSGFTAFRGRLKDVWGITSASVGGSIVGASFPNTGAPVQTVVSECLLPFDFVMTL